MCSPSPVASACWRDAQTRWGSAVTYLGIVGDQAHQTRRSSHNCAPMQESGAYHPNYAHALDIGHGGNRALATEIRNELLKDRRTRYVIDNAVGYYPSGGTFRSSGHHTHVHVSFNPGTTFLTGPFFGKRPLTMSQKQKLTRLAKEAAKGRRHLRRKLPPMRGRDVRETQYALGIPRTGVYGRGTERAVRKLQKWLKLPVTGTVNQRTAQAVMFFYLARAWG